MKSIQLFRGRISTPEGKRPGEVLLEADSHPHAFVIAYKIWKAPPARKLDLASAAQASRACRAFLLGQMDELAHLALVT